jgi:hypothetical protein
MLYPSKRFEDILGDCIAAIQERDETVEDCLTRYSGQREELEPLLHLAVGLRAARALTAPPEFRRTARTRMNDLIATRPRQATPSVMPTSPLHSVGQKLLPIFRMQTRFPSIVTIGVCMAIVLLAGSGAVYVSAAALPGDALYTVKTTVENVELALSPNDVGTAKLHLAFSTRRLGEASALLQQNRFQDIGQALAGYSTQIESVTALLGKGSRLSPNEQAVLANLLVTDLTRHEAQLTTLIEQAPEGTRPILAMALQVSKTQHDRALEAIGTGPGNGIPAPTPMPTPVATATLPRGTPTPVPSPRLSTSTGSPEPQDWQQPRRQTPEPTAWATPSQWPTPPQWPATWPTGWPTPPGWHTTWPTRLATSHFSEQVLTNSRYFCRLSKKRKLR